eukprot:scaffold877_cov314-Pavlova_lutheri.AAC.2
MDPVEGAVPIHPPLGKREKGKKGGDPGCEGTLDPVRSTLLPRRRILPLQEGGRVVSPLSPSLWVGRRRHPNRDERRKEVSPGSRGLATWAVRTDSYEREIEKKRERERREAWKTPANGPGRGRGPLPKTEGRRRGGTAETGKGEVEGEGIDHTSVHNTILAAADPSDHRGSFQPRMHPTTQEEVHIQVDGLDPQHKKGT